MYKYTDGNMTEFYYKGIDIRFYSCSYFMEFVINGEVRAELCLKNGKFKWGSNEERRTIDADDYVNIMNMVTFLKTLIECRNDADEDVEQRKQHGYGIPGYEKVVEEEK